MNDKIEKRLEKLEKEILKYKKTTLIPLVFSVVCGGGGLLGVATWITSIPKESKEIAKIQVETNKLALEIVKDSLEITSKKFEEMKAKHRTEIESITRQVELFKSLGSQQKVEELMTVLIDKEHQFQALITTTAEMCRRLALNSTVMQKQMIGPGSSDSQDWVDAYLLKMETLKQRSVKSELILTAN